MTYIDTPSVWDERPTRKKGDTRLFPHIARDPACTNDKAQTLTELRDRISAVPPCPVVDARRDTDTERLEILKSLRKDGLLPDAPTYLANHITAFLFLAFFPLGLALYSYGRVFGPSLRVSLTVFFMWWLNFAVVMFLL